MAYNFVTKEPLDNPAYSSDPTPGDDHLLHEQKHSLKGHNVKIITKWKQL
jgi:hypothetical protein